MSFHYLCEQWDPSPEPGTMEDIPCPNAAVMMMEVILPSGAPDETYFCQVHGRQYAIGLGISGGRVVRVERLDCARIYERGGPRPIMSVCDLAKGHPGEHEGVDPGAGRDPGSTGRVHWVGGPGPFDREIFPADPRVVSAPEWPAPTEEMPDIDTLEEWAMDTMCDATDGCTVEHDGTCEHGHPSWFLRLGMI